MLVHGVIRPVIHVTNSSIEAKQRKLLSIVTSIQATVPAPLEWVLAAIYYVFS